MLFSCGTVARTGDKVVAPRRSTNVFGCCQDITRSSRSDTVRVVARYGTCCNVEKAVTLPIHTEQMARPASRFDVDSEAVVCEASGVGKSRLNARAKIQVEVARASGLPNRTSIGSEGMFAELRVTSGDPIEAFRMQDLRKRNAKSLEAKTVFKARTKTIRGSVDLNWREKFVFDMPSGDSTDDLFLYFRLWRSDAVSKEDCFGHVAIALWEALADVNKLNFGWRALLRQCDRTQDRLALLQEYHGQSSSAAPHQIKTFGRNENDDSSRTELFILAKLLPERAEAQERSHMGVPMAKGTNSGNGIALLHASERAHFESELARAAFEGQITECLYMLRLGVAVNARSTDGPFQQCAPLHIACLRGHRDLAMALVDVFHASLVQLAPGGLSVAMCACKARDEVLAQWLIVEGCPADLRDDGGCSALHHSAAQALPQLTAWLLIKLRMDPTDTAIDGATPLASAVSSAHPSAALVAQQLLEAKASANDADRSGCSPLHVACEAANEGCVQILLGFGGARVDVTNAKGETPALLAKLAGIQGDTLQQLMPYSELDCEERVGETAAEAERRELRARKAEVSEVSWRNWRSLHPSRSVPGSFLDCNRGVGHLSPGPSARRRTWDDEEFVASAASARTEHSIESMPIWVGKAHSMGHSPGRAQSVGRLHRLKSWATSLTRQRPKSASPRGGKLDSSTKFESIPSRPPGKRRG
mmetsp:Transcript_44777/g.114026  ORF Transcript_44777/g.114026 Transcript_44777/m.114026 type:complete len:705 (-) Transcript_44777:28-2142(-)